jgi:MFS family permease
MADSFRLSGLLGALLGLYCLTLPKTPPQTGKQKFAPFEALGEVRKMPLVALFLVSFPIACVHQFYFVHTAGFLGTLKHPAAASINEVFGVGGGGLMTIGQMAEIFVLAFMPLLARAMSRKTLLTIGLLAYIARFAVFAYAPVPSLVLPALALHGFLFGCFFFVAFMIVDEETSPDVRASAQGLFNVIVVGFGVIAGNWFAGKIAERARGDSSILFGVPMWICVGCLALLLLFYPRRGRAVSSSLIPATERGMRDR